MEQNNYLKIVWIAAFVAFAGVSCWATAESLHMLLSSWPKIMCWIVTVGFFIIASFGTKMIVDSLNQNIYIDKRGLRLIGGIVLLLVFWLICSMPTNTHTFFYRTVIQDKTSSDISMTRGYLGQILNNTNNKAYANKKVAELKSRVDNLLGELEAEIMNEVNPGFGPKSKEILRKFAVEFGVAQIQPLTFKGTSKQDRERLCDAYRKKMYILFDAKAKNIISSIESPSQKNIDEVDKVDKNLALVQKYIADNTINLNDPEDVTGSNGVCSKLNEGYVAIKKNRNFVIFDPKTDEQQYIVDNPVTKVKRLISVFDVWEDYFHGEYAGHGFTFWIIISILVDIAAFIFFDLAFKKSEI